MSKIKIGIWINLVVVKVRRVMIIICYVIYVMMIRVVVSLIVGIIISMNVDGMLKFKMFILDEVC